MFYMNIGSNIAGPEDNKRQLRVRIMKELCAKDTDARNNIALSPF